jgi:hypothetical protein
VFLLPGVTITAAGCGCPISPGQPYSPRITGDGAGGAIAVYEDIEGGKRRDFYAQKIDPNGNRLWGEKGTLIGSSTSEFNNYFFMDIISDGAGGAITVWPELASGQRFSTTHVVRLDSRGNTVWRKDFDSVYRMVSDGAGGVIVADVPDHGNTIVLHRIDSSGNLPWGEKGIALPQQGNSCQIADDGAAGVVVVRQEREHLPGSEPGNARTQHHIYAYKIDSRGDLPWGEDGILMATTEENVYYEEPHIIGDGSGGAIVTWHRWPAGKIEEGMPEAFLNDFLVQKIDTNGNILWRPGGLPLEIIKATGEFFIVSNHSVISDNAGGAIIIWEDGRKGLANTYAQRIGSDGVIMWQPEGVEVSYIKSNTSFIFRQMVDDGQGGALVSCRFKNADNGKQGIMVQRLDSSGRKVWPGNGVVAVEGGTSAHSTAHDGRGGVIIAWGIQKGMFKSEEARIQRIDADGNLLWGKEGIKLNR